MKTLALAISLTLGALSSGCGGKREERKPAPAYGPGVSAADPDPADPAPTPGAVSPLSPAPGTPPAKLPPSRPGQPPTVDPTQPGVPVVRAKPVTEAILGLWRSACIDRSTATPQGTMSASSEDVSTAFADGNVTAVIRTYSSTANCQGLTYSTKISSQYAISGPSASLADAFDIDYTLAKIEVTQNSGPAADLANDAGACDINNWTSGVARDVTGAKCLNDTANLPAAGARLYDIFSLHAATLTFGLNIDPSARTQQTLDGSTPERRPVTLNDKEILTPAP